MEAEAKRRAPVAVVSEVLGWIASQKPILLVRAAYLKGGEVHELNVPVKYNKTGIHWSSCKKVWLDLSEAIQTGIFVPADWAEEGETRRMEQNRRDNQKRRARKQAEKAAKSVSDT